MNEKPLSTITLNLKRQSIWKEIECIYDYTIFSFCRFAKTKIFGLGN